MVFDDFLPESLCDAVLDEWPAFESIEWTTYDNPQELKHVCSDLGRLGPVTGGLLNAFNGSSFVRFVQVLSGVTPLLVDPHFQAVVYLRRATRGVPRPAHGLHPEPARVPGGRLGPELLGALRGGTGLCRRVNVLLYLNHDGRPEHGGALELWGREPFARVQEIQPVFNRMVVFTTLPNAIHGHPRPVSDPPHGSRKCLSAYYYTKERPFREMLLGGRHSVEFSDGARVPPPERGARLKMLNDLVVPPLAHRGLKACATRPRVSLTAAGFHDGVSARGTVGPTLSGQAAGRGQDMRGRILAGGLDAKVGSG